MLNKPIQYDVTVIVTTYEQSLDKTLLTIKSILLQEKVRYQLILADDGSRNNHFDQIKEYFLKRDICAPLLLESEENQGTIQNILRCFRYIKSDYVKLISPGDLLYGKYTLYQWVVFMKETGAEASFCDVINYSSIPSGYRIERMYAFPQAPELFEGGETLERQAYYQLVFNDYWLGASLMVSSDSLRYYLPIVSKAARYTEDNICRYMAYDGIKRLHFKKTAMLYECNSGITSYSERGNKWHKILMKEWETAGYDILKRKKRFPKVYRDLRYFIYWKSRHTEIRGSSIRQKDFLKTLFALVPLYWHIPLAVGWHLRLYLYKRYTVYNVDARKIEQLFGTERNT